MCPVWVRACFHVAAIRLSSPFSSHSLFLTFPPSCCPPHPTSSPPFTSHLPVHDPLHPATTIPLLLPARRSKNCGHVYSKVGIMSIIKNSASAGCPVAGCKKKVTKSSLEVVRDARADYEEERKQRRKKQRVGGGGGGSSSSQAARDDSDDDL